MQLSRPSIGATALGLFATAWITFAVNPVFWAKVSDGFGDHLAGMAAFSIGIVALTACALIGVSVKYLIKPLYIFLFISAAASSWFMQQYGVIIDTGMIRNAAETTRSEAGHLLSPAFLVHMTFYGLLPSMAVMLVRVRHRPIAAKVKHNLFIIIPLLALTTALAVWQFPAIASTLRNNKLIIKTLNPLTPIASTVKYAVRSGQERTIVAAPLDTDATLGETAAKASKPVLTVIVVGETARAQDFSLGGYKRKTNPNLEKQNIAYFSNTTSCGTATAASVPCMFSRLTRSQYSHDKGLAEENLLDVLRHAGLKVTWWENNTGDKKVAARIESRNFSVENDPAYCVDNECRDEVMVAALGQWLDGVSGNSTLVIHQLGSHGPAYYARYSDDERMFQPDCRTSEFADCSAQEIRNAYDNTIIATDRMLSEIIDQLDARGDRLASTMIYMSDHGESLGENGLYLHGMPYLFAPDEQTRIPFLMWISRSYADIFGFDAKCLRRQATAPFSHDNLFHTVLGLMDVEAPHYDPDLDVTARCRAPQGQGLESRSP
ncbi:phosphoethanolamine transferase [Hoeflea sp.]|uniref:phosphoethanolamine transferase n=1 Tax=Hoeflea sp. TaxID=1940281 RepID=UPI003BAE2C9B